MIFQFDDWWYYDDIRGGVKNWTAKPDVFPNGIRSLVNKTGWRVFAHNKYWYQFNFRMLTQYIVHLYYLLALSLGPYIYIHSQDFNIAIKRIGPEDKAIAACE